MPIALKAMPKSSRGRAPKYDFSKLFEERKPVGLVQGTEDEVKAGKADFTAKPDSFRQTLRTSFETWRDQNGIEGERLKTQIVEHEGRKIVAMQVIPVTDSDEGDDETE